MRKLLILLGLAGVAAWVYKTINEQKAYDAVWTDATAFDDAEPLDLDGAPEALDLR
jgi:hypothetical protein